MQPQADTKERPDILLDEAFRRATGGAISSPNVLQQALFPRLLTQDSGLLVPTGPAAGRLEAVYVPTLGWRADSAQFGIADQRLFVIAADGVALDDYSVRLGRYLRALATATGEPRTLYVASAKEGGVSERYLPDGSAAPDSCDHPLGTCVDLTVAPFAHFRSLFFGAGGVHALPQSLAPAEGDLDMRPRDLFYFDEAMGYGREEFTAFLRLIQFLFTQDLDLVIGTTTLPAECQRDLSFLEIVNVPEAQREPARTLQWERVAEEARPARMAELAQEARSEGNARVFLCVDDPAEVDALYQHLAQSGQRNLYRYHSAMPRAERLATYARLQAGPEPGYLMVTDGAALASADLSATDLVTTVCAPEALIRRGGCVNRRSEDLLGRIVIVGDVYPKASRPLPEKRRSDYLQALSEARAPIAFQPGEWKEFIA